MPTKKPDQKTSKEMNMPKGKVPPMNKEKKGMGHSGMPGMGKGSMGGKKH